MKKYWLMKSEPDVYSIDTLKKEGESNWEGVRNYQARNFMINDMNIGDEILFYHSSTVPPGIAGLARVSKKAEPDKTQFDKKSIYYDPKATTEKPIWFCVQVAYQEHFKHYITLEEIKNDNALKDILVIQRGQRLSIQPVSAKNFQHLCKIGKK